jgi:hypothetical protein
MSIMPLRLFATACVLVAVLTAGFLAPASDRSASSPVENGAGIDPNG